MDNINDLSKLYSPEYIKIQKDTILLIEPNAPNWIATNEKGEWILNFLKQGKTLKELIYCYSKQFQLEFGTSWVDINRFLKTAIRHNFISKKSFSYHKYSGRNNYITPKLKELWIHTNDSCNLECEHCLVNSSPNGSSGLPTEKIKKIIDDAHENGVKNFYFTGGEPFLRKDIIELIEYTLKKGELVILTNGSLLKGKLLQKLKKINSKKLTLQISLDGSNERINDRIRGEGSFQKTLEGIKNIVDAGINVCVATVILSKNIDDIPNITRLVGNLGIKNHHFLWFHRKGRGIENHKDFGVTTEQMFNVLQLSKEVGKSVGVVIDNLEMIYTRLSGQSNIKYDLSNGCVESLCVYSDGNVYPSASFVGVDEFKLGNILEKPLYSIWNNSNVIYDFRIASVQSKKSCKGCNLQFICGGGDIEHSYYYSKIKSDKGSILEYDPYCEFYKSIIYNVMEELGNNRKKELFGKSKNDGPIIYSGMSENGSNDKDCINKENYHVVNVTHSNCVLKFEIDKYKNTVHDFYSTAAKEPQESLCCPIRYNPDDLSHIPQEVLERRYGCSSPVDISDIKNGETVVDLGSGAGIDCFIAAKKVGPNGKVIGIDMTDDMLNIARESNKKVIRNLNYDVVEFRKGYLEYIPVEDKSTDLIVSNCVINLSHNKKKVFKEMWRILNDGGRIVVSDIVSEKFTPNHIKNNELLWNECLGGALTEEEFLTNLELVGFYGISVLERKFWKEIDGYNFCSITIRGYKFEKNDLCKYMGQEAIYLGLYKAVIDDEGHIFGRGEKFQICTDTAEKLKQEPYCRNFIIIEFDDPKGGNYECDKKDKSCCS